MAVQTTKDLSVAFGLDDGNKMSMTIPDYKPEITDAVIKTQLEAVVTAGALAAEGHKVTKVVSATKVDKTQTDVSLA
ncbi:MAG: DUF2922 domain-containing protein [Eubacteriaceae bacterium]|jgi:hypothetical protein|nr:DUF2922 domain-containing protein [Eubacteriaceae bacterium]